MRAYLNGEQITSKSGLRYIQNSDQYIDTLMFDNFFGGSSGDAASKNEVWALSVVLPCLKHSHAYAFGLASTCTKQGVGSLAQPEAHR
jgi:hypothetical protein